MPLPNPAIKTPEGKSDWEVDENGPSLRHHFKKEPEGSQYCSWRLTKLEHQTEFKFYHLSKFCCRDRVLWQGSHLTGVRCCLIFVVVRASNTICWSDPFHHRWPESEAFEFTLYLVYLIVEHGITGESSLKNRKKISQDQATFRNLIIQKWSLITISFFLHMKI